MALLRSLLVNLISRHFRPVRLPALLETIVKTPQSFILVSQSNSIIIQGLLVSFAKRLGLAEVSRITSANVSNTRQSSGVIYWVCVHDTALIATLSRELTPPQFSTLNLFHLRGPVRNPPQHKPGLMWSLSLLLARRLLYVVCGTPFTLPDMPETRLLRVFKVDFYRNLKIVRGTPLQSLETQERIILSGSEYERELRILAERSNQPLWLMRRKALSAFRDMAANPRRIWYGVIAGFSGFIVRRLFTEVITQGIDRLVPAVKDHPVVLVPLHRSHLDYILVGSKLYESKVNPPLVAAGINLRFWPAGYFIRSVGGYFVKRNARDRLHALLLKRYMMYLVKRGHLQEFFVEGGRSRSGKMLQPKLGLLSVILEAFQRGVRKEILFVPVSITYENLIEDETFGFENTGRSKQKESLLSLIRAFDIFRRKYGEVIVNFGEPLPLSRFVAEMQASTHENGNGEGVARRARSEERSLVQELGLTLVRSIRDQINPSLTSLAYTALLLAPHYGLTRNELVELIKRLARYVQILKSRGIYTCEFTPALERFLAGREYIVNDIARGGTVKVEACLDSQVFFIPGRTRFTADFYKNSTIHLFFPLALLALLELLEYDLTGSEALRFHSVFEYDFILPKAAPFARQIDALVSVLREEDIIASHDGRTRFVDRSFGSFFIPSLLLSSIQSLLWVHSNLTRAGRLAEEEEDLKREAPRAFAFERFIEALQSDFKIASYRGIATRTEAASRTALTAALESLHARQIINLQDSSGQRSRILVKQECPEEVRLLSRANTAILRWEQSILEKNNLTP